MKRWPELSQTDHRTVGAWLAIIALAASAGLASCGDNGPSGPSSQEEEPEDSTEVTPPPPGLAVSEPVAASGSAGSLAAAEGLVYVSAEPGTFPGGVSASITNLATGESASAAIDEGGFDPVVLMGSPGDELEIEIRNGDGSTTLVRTTVPARKRPRVVRTQPPKDATDVVLRGAVFVVFTEPVEASTVTLETVKLLLDGEPVEAALELSFDGLRATLTPADSLAPETVYTLLVTTGITDLAGDSLDEEVEVSFTTESVPPPPPEGVVVFERFDVSQQTSTVYRMNLDGTGLVALAEGDGPAWSPDGSKIAFVKDEDIYVMNADGTGAVNITNSPGREFFPPAWSPDGSQIAYTVDERNGNWEVYVMSADGSAQVNLTNDPAFDAQPTWSPDGSTIAFSSDRDLITKPYVMDADGSNVVKLNDFEAVDLAWSPDGSKIAFTTAIDGNAEVYVMNSDGTGALNLTSDPARDRMPAWSPDGNKIVFSSFRDFFVPGDPPYDIYVMNADGSGVLRITGPDDELDFNADWRP